MVTDYYVGHDALRRRGRGSKCSNSAYRYVIVHPTDKMWDVTWCKVCMLCECMNPSGQDLVRGPLHPAHMYENNRASTIVYQMTLQSFCGYVCRQYLKAAKESLYAMALPRKWPPPLRRAPQAHGYP